MTTFTIILSLLSGVALFLFGMSLMGDGLKKVAGNKLELVLYKLTNTPLKGVLLGTAVTAIIQSSSATTVMVVGFCVCRTLTVRTGLHSCCPRRLSQRSWRSLVLSLKCL